MKFKVVVKTDKGSYRDESVEFMSADEAIKFIKAYVAVEKHALQSAQAVDTTKSPIINANS